MKSLDAILLECASEAFKRTNASALLLYLDPMGERGAWKGMECTERLVLVTRSAAFSEELAHEAPGVKSVLLLPDVNLTRLGQVKLSIIMSITSGVIGGADTVVCVSGVPGLGSLDTVIAIDLSRENEVFRTSGITADLLGSVAPEVFDTVLNLALELATEGREGGGVGTTFVIGDNERVTKLSRPLIMNPFMGYPEQDRNILDAAIHETIKEFSLLDGAFVIREDGVVMAAGVHLDAALEDEGLMPGLGCRHMAAAGMTDVTEAVAVTISGSTGIVRIFRNGKTLMEIEKPQAAPRKTG